MVERNCESEERGRNHAIGSGYTSVWHRDQAGKWTFFQDVAPEPACSRYFGKDIEHDVYGEILDCAYQWVAHHGEIEALLARNNDQAESLGLQGTPAFIIGNYLVEGGMDLAGLRAAVAKVRARPVKGSDGS